MWGLFYFVRTDVNVLRLKKKKITIINLTIFSWSNITFTWTTNTTFIITLATITTYHLLLEKNVKYFVFLNLLIVWRPVHTSL